MSNCVIQPGRYRWAVFAAPKCTISSDITGR
jgi:hypothetical protein